jgi:hypothetical protein
MRVVQPKLKRRIEAWSMKQITSKRHLERSLRGPHTKKREKKIHTWSNCGSQMAILRNHSNRDSPEGIAMNT